MTNIPPNQPSGRHEISAPSPDARRLDRRIRIVVLPNGEPAAIIDTEITEDGPPELREGLARRSIVNAGGTCPCGARMTMPNRRARRAAKRRRHVLEVLIEHQVGCPASTESLSPLIRQWAAS